MSSTEPPTPPSTAGPPGPENLARGETTAEEGPLALESGVVNAYRETRWILGLFLISLLWCVPYGYLFGYRQVSPEQPLSITWGVPSWVLWGVFVPWLLIDVATVWISLVGMQDDDLGEEPSAGAPPEPLSDQAAHS
jgi:hypothetical protein